MFILHLLSPPGRASLCRRQVRVVISPRMIRFVRGRLARAEIDAHFDGSAAHPQGAASEAERLPLEHDVCPERQAAARLLGELDRQFQFSDAVAHRELAADHDSTTGNGQPISRESDLGIALHIEEVSAPEVAVAKRQPGAGASRPELRARPTHGRPDPRSPRRWAQRRSR